jgi:hypothetical protein
VKHGYLLLLVVISSRIPPYGVHHRKDRGQRRSTFRPTNHVNRIKRTYDTKGIFFVIWAWRSEREGAVGEQRHGRHPAEHLVTRDNHQHTSRIGHNCSRVPYRGGTPASDTMVCTNEHGTRRQRCRYHQKFNTLSRRPELSRQQLPVRRPLGASVGRDNWLASRWSLLARRRRASSDSRLNALPGVSAGFAPASRPSHRQKPVTGLDPQKNSPLPDPTNPFER